MKLELHFKENILAALILFCINSASLLCMQKLHLKLKTEMLTCKIVAFPNVSKVTSSDDQDDSRVGLGLTINSYIFSHTFCL